MTTSPAPSAEALHLCAADALAERGRAVVFDVMHFNQPARAFALRFGGRVVAYLNRCVHALAELDWQPGEFLDADRELIICALHGALYEPTSGRCVGGPCSGGRLTRIDIEERAGEVYWYPSRDVQPCWQG